MCEKCKLIWKVFLVAAILFGCLLAVWTFIHRRLIRAAVKSEPLPVCPHWLPGLVEKLLAAK